MTDPQPGSWSRRRARRSFTSVLSSLAVTVVAALPAAAAATDACEPWLDRVAELGAARGYVVERSPGQLAGRDGAHNSVHAACAADRAELEFVAPDLSRVHVAWSSVALELRGEFAGAHVEQSWRGNVEEQQIRHRADTGALAASAEFDAASQSWSVDGDLDGVNAWFEPVLAGSTIWRDAYRIVHVLTGVWDAGLQQDESALQIALGLALPPIGTVDIDKGGVKKDCGATIGICAVAYFWKPLTGACVAAGAKCLAAFKCWKSDCSGDG